MACPIVLYFEKYLNEQVTDQAVSNYYNTKASEYEQKKAHVAHILIRLNSKMSEEERKVKLTTAQEAYSKIRAGEDFAEIALQYSEDKISAKKGGDLGWVKEGAIDKKFSQTLFGLAEGGISEPFETPFGFHIVKLIEAPQIIKQPEKTSETTPQKQTVTQSPTVESDVLATVNGTAITKNELEQALVRMVGEEVASTLEDQAKKKVLESLVLSRAISQARTEEMSADEKKHLQREVNAYREQLLTRQYIAGHGSPQPISAEEVEQYYAAHPERFGGGVLKKYEMITCKRPLAPAEKDELLQILEDSEKHTDWRQWAIDLAAQGYPVAYRQGRDDEKLLHLKLTRLLASLTMEQKPQLLFIRKIPYLVRLKDVEKSPLQPLDQVAAKIRKILAQQQIRKTVEKVSKEVLAKAEVKYVD